MSNPVDLRDAAVFELELKKCRDSLEVLNLGSERTKQFANSPRANMSDFGDLRDLEAYEREIQKCSTQEEIARLQAERAKQLGMKL